MVRKTIILTRSAERELDSLPPQIQLRIEQALDALAQGRAGDAKRLKGSDKVRLRVGDFRVFFIETETSIEISAIGNRNDIYR